jgi:hypothetical protein
LDLLDLLVEVTEALGILPKRPFLLISFRGQRSVGLEGSPFKKTCESTTKSRRRRRRKEGEPIFLLLFQPFAM